MTLFLLNWWKADTDKTCMRAVQINTPASRVFITAFVQVKWDGCWDGIVGISARASRSEGWYINIRFLQEKVKKKQKSKVLLRKQVGGSFMSAGLYNSCLGAPLWRRWMRWLHKAASTGRSAPYPQRRRIDSRVREHSSHGEACNVLAK